MLMAMTFLSTLRGGAAGARLTSAEPCVSTPERLTAAPAIPTIAEAGLPGFEASQWYGVVAPAQTPGPVVAQLNAAIRRAMTTQKIAAALERDGAISWVGTPEEFRSHIVAEI